MSLDSDLVALFTEIAPQVGARLTVEPTYRRGGILEFGNGAVLFFRANSVNVNVAGNVRMARDKSFLSSFLAGMGFRVLPEIAVARDEVRRGAIAAGKRAQVLAFAEQNGWRVIVKPNGLSQGRGVRLITDRELLIGTIADTLKLDRVCIVQQPCAMPEYRLVVLQGVLLQAYQRRPLRVRGDGTSTLAELASRARAALAHRRGEASPPQFLATTARMLAANGRALTDVPAAAEEIVVADIANLAAGGEAVDVMQVVHPRWVALAADLARRCGLMLCGVDLFVADIGDGGSDYRVIELNGAPGLDDFVLEGDAQRQRVAALYRTVLQTAAATLIVSRNNSQGNHAQ
jgi:glutathione synthase/RimK-type ligase-like ATP-grasp enzyme